VLPLPAACRLQQQWPHPSQLQQGRVVQVAIPLLLLLLLQLQVQGLGWRPGWHQARCSWGERCMHQGMMCT
jgi:hypothetical protein